MLRDTKAALTDIDWKVITDFFNEEAADMTIPPETALAPREYKKNGQMVMSNPGNTKGELTVPHRSVGAIKAIVSHWPHVRKMMEDVLAEVEEEKNGNYEE